MPEPSSADQAAPAGHTHGPGNSDAHPEPLGVAPETLLILTPVKNAARFADSYFAALARLTYPAAQISLGLLESDSDDDSYACFAARLAAVSPRYGSARIWRRSFGYRFPLDVPRWHHAIQLPRRKVLAKARNHLLFRALDDQDWVLWLDVDVIDYPPDLIERLLATGRDIVHPHCVQQPGGPTFDRNGWREHGRVLLEDLRDGPDLVRLDSVGGTVLLIRADLHRDGLIFPSFPYGAANRAVRRPHPLGVAGELETEGLGIMALDMGHQCWGMPKPSKSCTRATHRRRLAARCRGKTAGDAVSACCPASSKFRPMRRWSGRAAPSRGDRGTAGPDHYRGTRRNLDRRCVPAGRRRRGR